MQQKRFRKLWIGIAVLLCLSAIGVGIVAISTYSMWRMRVRVYPPIPAEATSLQVFHPFNDMSRSIKFEVEAGAVDRIRQFYRTELPKDGWRYRCTMNEPLNTLMEVMDVYERDTMQNPKGETLEIEISKQSAGGKRVINLEEWIIRLPYSAKDCTAQ